MSRAPASRRPPPDTATGQSPPPLFHSPDSSSRLALARRLALTFAVPIVQVLVDIARVQDEEVGDGTTSVAVLCGELLREAEELIGQRIHPQTIIEGWRKSAQIAREKLEEMSVDNSADDAKVCPQKQLPKQRKRGGAGRRGRGGAGVVSS